MSTTMTFTITKRQLVTALLSTLLLSLSVCWLLIPGYPWFFGSAIGLTLIAALTLLIVYREEPSSASGKTTQKHDKKRVNRLFKTLLRELRDRGQFKQKYRLPWYIFINQDHDDTVLYQMGFRQSSQVLVDKDLPVGVWLNNNAVVLAFSLSGHDSRTLNTLKLLLQRVKRFRSRQALNGIILSQPIDGVLCADKSSSKQMTQDCRLLIDNTQSLCGQTLPIYVLFNRMANVADLSQFFASLEEKHLEGCFGALNGTDKDKGKYTQTWFNKAFDDLCSRMGKAVFFALERQLNESYRQSVVSAPMQVRQLKDRIGFYLSELLSEKSKANAYQFRGFFFVNTDGSEHVEDPLAKQVAYQLDYHEMVETKTRKLSQSFFITELFNQYIRPEAGLAQVNRVRRRLHTAFQVIYSLFIVGLVGSTIWLFNANSEYYQKLNADSLERLDSYKKQVQQQPYAKEKLFENVEKLSVLRDIYQQYKAPAPFYISSFIPNPSVESALRQAYHEELSTYLLPGITNSLEVKLDEYKSSQDVLQTANMLTVVKALKNHNEKEWGEVEHYFQEFGKENGIEKKTQSLVKLMGDAFTLGLPNIALNEELVRNSESFIHQMNSAVVLYRYIKDLPQFTGNVDVAKELGSNFSQLFNINKPERLTVPYLFTPQGFAALDLNPQSELLKDVIRSNQALLGKQLSDYEVNSLVQQLLRLYQREYIKTWQAFIDSVSIKALTSENLGFHLQLLTQKADAPLSKFYDVINYNTSPALKVVTPAAPQEQSITEKAKSLIGDEEQKPVTPSADQMAMEKAIRDTFATYHNFVSTDEQGKSPLTEIVSGFAKVKTWLDETKQHKDLGAQYFQQLTAPKKDQSLFQLSQIQSEIAVIDDYRRTMIEIISQDVNVNVRGYVEAQWQKQVYQPFTANFASKFPFDIDSDQDVDLKIFNRHFKAGGFFSTYQEQLFSQFESLDGQRFITGFIPGQNIYIQETVLEQFKHLTDIQDVLYLPNQNNLAVPFKLSVNDMSASAVKFELFSQRSLLVYQHGPKLWFDFNWPDLATSQELLATFTNTSGQKSTLSYSGDWAWIRMIYQNYVNSQQGTQITLNAESEKVSFILTVNSDENPLEPNFFSRFKLPDKLLQAAAN